MDFDAPVLHHFVAHQGNGVAVLAGPTFQEEDYGLVFALDSPLGTGGPGAADHSRRGDVLDDQPAVVRRRLDICLPTTAGSADYYARNGKTRKGGP